MKKEILHEARVQTGKYLLSIAEGKNIDIRDLAYRSGVEMSDLENILEGSEPYLFDDFLKVVRALDCYFYLAHRDGKHLDHDDMISKSNEL